MHQSLTAFVWLACGMGALSLLTPCVFPMIPITVSYFTDHGARDRSGALGNAIIFGLGIVLTFTALGMAMALLFGAGSVNRMAANPWVNLLLTAIFLGFGFSLFGAFSIRVPGGLLNRLGGVSRRKGTGRLFGTLVMGLVFTLTSFTCTAPFIGTMLVLAAAGDWKWPLIGMLAFSAVFALPFFILALVPQLLSQMPKAGGWLNSVKVVMGFLEVAAAMKFLANADLIWHWGIFTRETVLAIWVAIGILTVVYLLGKFQMPHDSLVSTISASRAVLAIAFLAVSIWLGTGLFGRSLGGMDAFLPLAPAQPASAASADPAGHSASLSWIENNFPAALAQARQQNKPLFVNFTGYTCTNCRWMEANMFSRPQIKSRLRNFVRAELYTDGQGKVYADQQKLENDRFGTVALPLYAIVSPSGKTVATFLGLTRKPSEFLAFLSK
ncbi:MAG: protein-disulfide reductase DsbD family protein [Terriglobales bacterium]